MYLTHICEICGSQWEENSVPNENDICERCIEMGYQIPLKKEDLVTGTPVTEEKGFKYWTKDQWSFLFEWVKLVQRVVMVVLTIVLVIALNRSAIEIQALKVETARIANIAENGCRIAEETRKEIYEQIEEIQRDGLKLRFRIW